MRLTKLLECLVFEEDVTVVLPDVGETSYTPRTWIESGMSEHYDVDFVYSNYDAVWVDAKRRNLSDSEVVEVLRTESEKH